MNFWTVTMGALFAGFFWQAGKMVAIQVLSIGFSGKGGDSTDRVDGEGKRRSGMALMTDYGTGVEYLMGPSGSLTPRLGKDGRPWQ